MSPRLATIRASARRMARAAGKPINLSQAEVLQIRKELADAIASGQHAEQAIEDIAALHGVPRRKVRFCGMASFSGGPRLILYAQEIRERRATMGPRHRTHVRTFEGA